MLRLATTALFLCGVWLASSQAAELYDPNLIAYDPQPTSMPECGFSIGLDKTWKFETNEKENKEKNYTEYFYEFDSDIKLKPRPFDLFVFQPQVSGYLNCHVSIDKNGKQRTGERLAKFVKSFTDILHKGEVEKASYVNISEVEETAIAGLDVAYIYHADIPAKKGTEFTSDGVILWLAGVKGDVFVNGIVQIRDPVGGKKLFPKGTTVRQKHKGKTIEVELANDATLVEKVYYGTRTLDQDRAYVMELLRSIH